MTVPGYTQDWRTNPIAAALNVHRKRIDYVFVGDPFLRARRRRPGAAPRRSSSTSRSPASLASDHSGLVVDIVWPDRPS